MKQTPQAHDHHQSPHQIFRTYQSSFQLHHLGGTGLCPWYQENMVYMYRIGGQTYANTRESSVIAKRRATQQEVSKLEVLKIKTRQPHTALCYITPPHQERFDPNLSRV